VGLSLEIKMSKLTEDIEQFKPNFRNIKVEFNSIPEFFDKVFAEIEKTKSVRPKEKKKVITELQSNYNNAVNEYIKVFEKKHGYYFTDWVGSEVGGIACFIEQYFFNFSDIKLDIDQKVKKNLIFEYQDDCLSHPKKTINFKSYVMGLRFEDIKMKCSRNGVVSQFE
jgi:hypothetical protein